MSEYYYMYVVFGAMIGVCVGALLYSAGGRQGKWKRRFLASFVLSTSLITAFLLLKSFSWWLLLIYPLTIITFSLGYGADALQIKLLKRALIVLSSLITSVGICVLFGGNSWLVLPVEILVSAVTIYLGVKNPIHASAEEFFICLFLWSPKLAYPFIV